MAEPPLEVGAVHVNATLALEVVAESPVGASGVVLGVAVAVADAGPTSVVFLAITENV